jgi:hypothetical protein
MIHNRTRKGRGSSTRSAWRARPGEIFNQTFRFVCRVTHPPPLQRVLRPVHSQFAFFSVCGWTHGTKFFYIFKCIATGPQVTTHSLLHWYCEPFQKCIRIDTLIFHNSFKPSPHRFLGFDSLHKKIFYAQTNRCHMTKEFFNKFPFFYPSPT